MGTRKIGGPILAVGFSSAVLHEWCSAAAWEGAFRVGFAACAQLTLLDLQSPLPVFTKSASSSCWWCVCTSLPPCQILATWTCSILEECRLHAPCDMLLASSNDGYGDTEKAPHVECAPTPSPSWCALNSEERAPQAGGCQPPARQSHGVGPGRSDGCGVHNSARWTGLRPCPQDSIGRPQRSAGERAPTELRVGLGLTSAPPCSYCSALPDFFQDLLPSPSQPRASCEVVVQVPRKPAACKKTPCEPMRSLNERGHMYCTPTRMQ
jgi:hypothetical protein